MIRPTFTGSRIPTMGFALAKGYDLPCFKCARCKERRQVTGRKMIRGRWACADCSAKERVK